MSCIDSHVLRSAAAYSRCDYELYGRLVGVAESVVDVLCAREFDLEIDAHYEPLTLEERELWWRLHTCRRRIEFAMIPSSEWERRYHARYEEVRSFLFPPRHMRYHTQAHSSQPVVVSDDFGPEDIPF